MSIYPQNSSHVISTCPNPETLNMEKSHISATELGLSATENLLPYYNYTITVVAVNEVGKGHPAEKMETTLEEGILCFLVKLRHAKKKNIHLV